MIELGGRERPEAVWRVRADKWRAVDVEDAREFMPLHDASLVEPDAQVLLRDRKFEIGLKGMKFLAEGRPLIQL